MFSTRGVAEYATGEVHRALWSRFYRDATARGVIAQPGGGGSADHLAQPDPTTLDTDDTVVQMEALTSRGRPVICSADKFEWGNNTQTARLEDLLTFAQVTRGWFAPGSIDCWGISAGSLAVLNLARELGPDVVRKIVCLLPLVNVQRIWDEDLVGGADLKESITAAHGGRPADADNPLDNAAAFADFEILLVYSTNDTVCIPADVEDFAELSGARLHSMGDYLEASFIPGHGINEPEQIARLVANFLAPVQARPIRPPLALAVEVEAADGTTIRWDGDSPADRRPRGIGFRTQRGDGFADGSVTLARRLDTDLQDARLLDTMRMIGADGTIAYEGRIVSQPRSLGPDGHSIAVEAVGWSSHLRDRPFSFIYQDRDVSRWGPAPTARRQAVLTAGRNLADASTAAGSTGTPALMMSLVGPWTTGAACEAWYYGGAAEIADVTWVRTSSSEAAAQPSATFEFYAAFSDDGENVSATSDQHTAIADGEFPAVSHIGGPSPWAAFIWRHTAANPNGSQYDSVVYPLVRGPHGLTLSGDSGYPVSDLIRDLVGRFARRIDASGVQDTTYPVSQAAWLEPATVWDAIATLNGFHLWNLGVWENRRLDFSPPDLTVADWQIRTDDPGVSVNLQGDAVDQLANGVVVSYADLTRQQTVVLFPSAHAELREDDPDHPANRQGLELWTPLAIPFPTVEEDALAIGQAFLGDFNRPKAPGNISLASGYVRDSSGAWEPGWKVRAGQTVAITNHPNSAPRLIQATSWSDTRALEITLDAPAKRVEAILDRQQAARAARGLS